MAACVPLRRFHLFTLLPAELQIKIWQETIPRRGIHCFDVCIPGNKRIDQAFRKTTASESLYEQYKNMVFLDSFHADRENLTSAHDPSAYKALDRIRASCISAAETLKTKTISALERADTGLNTNSVYLPGRGRKIEYDNNQDILLLRFGSSVLGIDSDSEPRAFSSGISDALGVLWSAEIATTLNNAKRVALDIEELKLATEIQEVIYNEVSYLSCVLRKNLEVLFLVDHSGKRSQKCDTESYEVLNCTERKVTGGLAAELGFDGKRKLNVVEGDGITYREIIELERLGWDKDHPTFLTAKMFDEAIRNLQGEKSVFQGVRVLV